MPSNQTPLPRPENDDLPMRYIPNASEDIREMLAVIGIDSIDRLFETIPDAVKLDRLLDIPGPWSEIEQRRWFHGLARKNRTAVDHDTFLGAGAYSHFQPACVDQLLLRSEFLTSYTPYQPEVSQGTLQSIFEYQTHQCLLTGLDVANASLYDGSTALVEAVLLAERVSHRKKIVVARSVHPHYRDTVRTYIQNLGLELIEVAWGADGRIDQEQLRTACTSDVMAVAIQSPNFLGVVEDYDAVAAIADGVKATKIAVIAEASSLGLLSPPGAHGFDVAVGEGQAWGIPPQYGGPYVGFMVVRDNLKRHMPGRLVGETVDVDGRRAFVLTLATREQHIRRGKATSNICTNEALIALGANIYLSLMGREGLRDVALQCIQKAAYLREQLAATGLVELPFAGPIYNEFTVRTSRPASDVLSAFATRGILAGVAIGGFFSELPNDFLVAVTELNTREQLDRYVEVLRSVLTKEAQ
jgi:glycine dehydrogenase subunit 1